MLERNHQSVEKNLFSAGGGNSRSVSNLGAAEMHEKSQAKLATASKPRSQAKIQVLVERSRNNTEMGFNSKSQGVINDTVPDLSSIQEIQEKQKQQYNIILGKRAKSIEPRTSQKETKSSKLSVYPARLISDLKYMGQS